MKFAAGVLVILVVPPAALRPPEATPPPAPWIALAGQEWLADPVLPGIFQDVDSDAERDGDSSPSPLDLGEFLPRSSPAAQQESPPGAEPSAPDAFPKAVGALEVQAWRREDDLRRVREWAGAAALGAPLLVPQVLLEAFLPRGLAIGPTTFLYRTASPSSSLSLVVFDQVLFHEAEFMAQAQERGDAAYGTGFQRGQRRVLRRSLMSGFRANYAMPRQSLDQIFQMAKEQGALGYALLPPVTGALLYLKGADQRVELDQDVQVRFRVASGQNLWRDLHRRHENPAFSVELRLFDFPVGIITSFDLFKQGMTPSFIGLGTSLATVGELLSQEASTRLPPDAR
jgi:hypothetical protein